MQIKERAMAPKFPWIIKKNDLTLIKTLWRGKKVTILVTTVSRQALDMLYHV